MKSPYTLSVLDEHEQKIPLSVTSGSTVKVYGCLLNLDIKTSQTAALQRLDIHYTLRNEGSRPVKLALTFLVDLSADTVPEWMCPGCMYRNNRPAEPTCRYARYTPEGKDLDRYESDEWYFRADRMTTPAVLARMKDCTVGLASPEMCGEHLTSLGFLGNGREKRMELRIPWREGPMRNMAFIMQHQNQAVATELTLEPGKSLEGIFHLYTVPDGGKHAYDPALRDYYHLYKPSHPTKQWVNMDEALTQTAYGLYTWHYHPEYRALFETAVFDRLNQTQVPWNFVMYRGQKEGDEPCASIDRPNMHVSWVSGIPHAYALVRAGDRLGEPNYREAGLDVIDFIATEGISPSGLFYSEWSVVKGWGEFSGTPNQHWGQANTLGEATYYLTLAYIHESQHGIHHADWEKAIRSNLDFITAHQREDGNLGSYYNFMTGEVASWDGAAGLKWIPALLSAADALGMDAYRTAALKAGNYYKSFVEDEYVLGAPEDVALGVTSEDGYNALMAFYDLYACTGNAEHLRLARIAADWIMTFRFSYNVRFLPETTMGKYDIRTTGGDIASPSNNHIHVYGLIVFTRLLALSSLTGDPYYRERAMDNLLYSAQYIARYDGCFNAMRGMVPEQVNHTDWGMPKGMISTLSHTWCIGHIMHTSLDMLEGSISL